MLNAYLWVKETVEANAAAVEVTITPRRAMRTMFAEKRRLVVANPKRSRERDDQIGWLLKS